MPLIPTTLEREFSKIMDNDDPNFIGFKSNVSDVAEAWSNAMHVYSQAVIPAVLPPISLAAKNAMKGVLMGMVGAGSGIPLLPLAFKTYVDVIAPGMAAGGYTGVAPASQPNITPVFSIPLTAGTNQARVILLTTIIDTWIRTGTGTLIAPPNTVILWS